MIRDGNHSVADLMSHGAKIFGRRHVDPLAISTMNSLQVEGTFATGTHLVTVDRPISTEDGDLEMAMYGSCLAPPRSDAFPSTDELGDGDQWEKRAGALVCAKSADIVLGEGRPRHKVTVTNRGDRAIQVKPIACRLSARNHDMLIVAGRFALSLHRNEPCLDFDRLKAYGYHLDIPAGTSVRFELGDTKTVSLSEIGGLKSIRGGSSFHLAGLISPWRITSSVE